MPTEYSSLFWPGPTAAMSIASTSFTSAGIPVAAPWPTSSKWVIKMVVRCAGRSPASRSALHAVAMQATLALSSRWRERMKPVSVTSTRGSNATKSPTSIPSWRVSVPDRTLASSRTSIVASLRSPFSTSGPLWTCTDALRGRMVPRYTRPPVVMIEQASPSTLLHVNPPILLSRSRPVA